MDSELQSGTETQRVSIPSEVENFLFDFHTAIFDRNHELMKRLYEQDFNQLTETYYANTRWPSDFVVEAFYTERDMCHPVLTALYRELYYRHLLARCSADVAWPDRYLSSCNYRKLLEYFITEECRSDNVSSLTVPHQWLWDMLDEFVYQFQETQRWKAQDAKEIAGCETAMTAMHDGAAAWRASDVLHLLSGLIRASGIEAYLESERARAASAPAGGTPSRDAHEEPELPLLLGYFAIISLMRLHVAMGDYRTALQVAKSIDIGTNALYWKAPACHITLVYNLGFAYMMMRRYQDATRVLCQILTFVSRSRNYLSSQSYQQDVMVRMADRMYHLIMLCNTLSPGRLDEIIQTHIQERWADKYFKLQSDDEEAFKEVFTKACPKFCHSFISTYEDPEEVRNIDQHEPLNRQLNMFLKDVSYQNRVFNVRSIAKLYNNLTLSKLANLMGMTQDNAVEVVRSEMLCVKNRAEQLLWQKGPLLSGERAQMLADLDIYLDTDTIHVKNLTTHKNFVDLFIKQIHRTQDLLNVAAAWPAPKLDSRHPATAQPAAGANF